MHKHLYKLLTASMILAVLAVTWFWGGNVAKESGEDLQTAPADLVWSESAPGEQAAKAPEEAEALPEQPLELSPAVAATGKEAPRPNQEATPASKKEEPASTEPQVREAPPENHADKAETTCILSVRCDTLLRNITSLDKEKIELVPENGLLFGPAVVTFYEGENVFNVLQREMKKAKIHLAFRTTPIYHSAYIEAIHNLYEFDCGELSGWIYKVNGQFPRYGASRYLLEPDDVIEWVYTCDLGYDVGADGTIGGAQAE